MKGRKMFRKESQVGKIIGSYREIFEGGKLVGHEPY